MASKLTYVISVFWLVAVVMNNTTIGSIIMCTKRAHTLKYDHYTKAPYILQQYFKGAPLTARIPRVVVAPPAA